MKRPVINMLLIVCFLIAGKHGQAQGNITAKSTVIITNNDASITVPENALVPAKNVFYFYDATMTKLLATFREGQPVHVTQYKKAKKESKDPPKIDCVQINCPGSFGANATCWKCK